MIRDIWDHYRHRSIQHATGVVLATFGGFVMAQAQYTVIDIDEGTVLVELTSAPMERAYEFAFAAQGQCQPEVDIINTAEGVQARHTKNCHGTGRDEGTVFTLRLSTRSSHSLKLKAGRVSLTGAPGLGSFRSFSGEVSVGKIHNARSELAVAIQRDKLVGAKAQFAQAQAEQSLEVKVTYGEINIR